MTLTMNAFEASVARAATLRLDGELLGGRPGTGMGNHGKKAGRLSYRENGRTVQQPKQASGCHLHSCNLPARDGRALKQCTDVDIKRNGPCLVWASQHTRLTQ
jgi:hypothetical protein